MIYSSYKGMAGQPSIVWQSWGHIEGSTQKGAGRVKAGDQDLVPRAGRSKML